MRRFDFDVVGERHRALDERALGVEGARADASAAAELGHLGGEHARDVDHRRVALAERLDVEGHQDRLVVGGLDRLRDRLTAVGDDVIGHAAQEHAVAAPLPLHHAAPDRLASLPRADRRPGDLRDPEELLVQLVDGDLVVETLADSVDGEEPLVRLGLLRDDPVVRPDHRRRGWPARTAARRGRRRRRCLFRLRRRGRLLRRSRHRDGKRQKSANDHAGETRTRDARHVHSLSRARRRKSRLSITEGTGITEKSVHTENTGPTEDAQRMTALASCEDMTAAGSPAYGRRRDRGEAGITSA